MKTWLTVGEGAEYAGVSRDTIYTACERREPAEGDAADRNVERGQRRDRVGDLEDGDGSSAPALLSSALANHSGGGCSSTARSRATAGNTSRS